MMKRGAENDVMAAFCHNGSVATCFMNSLLAAFAEDARRTPRRLVEYHDAVGPYIHDNRARIARYFLENTDFQWLWMLDNDMEFPPDTLYRLLDAVENNANVRILAGAYWNEYPGTATYLSWLTFTPDGIKAVQRLPDTDQPLEVSASGMGCTLIHRDVVQDVADMHSGDPWDTFAADILVRWEDGGFMAAPSIEDFSDHIKNGRKPAGVDRMGEDVSFCLRARSAGYPTFGLPSLVVDHYKPHRVVPKPEESRLAIIR